MVIAAENIVSVVEQALRAKAQEDVRLRRIMDYLDGKHAKPYMPKRATGEYRWLVKRSVENFLPLISGVVSQNLHIDGYRRGMDDLDPVAEANANPADDDADYPEDLARLGQDEATDPAWLGWRANRMVSRQHGIFKSVAKFGSAYCVVTKANLDLPGSDKPAQSALARPVSPAKMTAFYCEDLDDEWPVFAIERQIIVDASAPGKSVQVIVMYDDAWRHILIGNAEGNNLRLADATLDKGILQGRTPSAQHEMGVCPVVRYMHEIDLDGQDCSGEIEPLIPIQDQVNFATFNLNITMQFAAFRQRYVIGMASTDKDGKPTMPFSPGVDRMMSSDSPDTKFGEFDVSPLAPYVETREASIRHMSTISQVPPYHLLGQVANLSAEALAAARDGFDSKIKELQAVLTDPSRNTFRLISRASGDMDGWNDLNGTVVWRDTSARAFAATIDGLAKAAQMLGVPVTELWRRIPGVTADEVNSWIRTATATDAIEELNKKYQAAVTAGEQTTTPTEGQPYQIGQYGAPPVGAKPTAPPAPGGPQPPK